MKKTPPPPPQDNHQEEAIHVWDCGSPLYDSYELASLSHVIDRHMMVLPSLVGSRQEVMIRSSRFSNNRHHVIPSSLFPGSSGSQEEPKKKKARGSCVAVAFLSEIMERNGLSWSWSWRRRICGGGEREGKKAKKVMMKFSDGICGVYNRISSFRK